jgi:hypothetical protein
MVRIVVDYDLIVGPIPIVDVCKVKRGDAEVEAVKPKAVGASPANAPDMAAAEATGKAAMLPGMIEMVAGVVSSGIVSHPLPVVMDVRSFGVVRLIAIGGTWRGLLMGRFLTRRGFSLRGFRHCAMGRRRAMFWNVSTTNGVTASATFVSVLRQGWQGKDQRYSENCGE